MSKTFLVSFAGAVDADLDAKLAAAQAVLVASAKTGEIDEIIAWNRMKLRGTSFYFENKEILDLPRGCGYWLWKPYIILEALRSVQEDDVVVYWDVGRIRPNRFSRPVTPLVNWCRNHQGMLPGIPIVKQGAWTKRDCFQQMGCDKPAFWNARQIQATFSIWSGRRAIEFVEEWLKWCKDRRCLTDDANAHELPNMRGFKEHRHDQSILTNLCVIHGVESPCPPPIPPGAWTKNINLWAELLESGALDGVPDAERACKAILLHEPEQPFALNRLGIICLKNNRMGEGLELLRRSVAGAPAIAALQCDLAVGLRKAGMHKESLEILARVIKQQKDHVAARCQRATTLAEMGSLDLAAKELQEALSLSGVRNSTSLQLQLGEIWMKLGERDRAQVAYRHALINNPESAAAWIALAHLLIHQMRHVEAIESLRHAQMLRPDDPDVHSALLRLMQCVPDLSQEEIFEEHMRWSRRHGSTMARPAASHPNVRSTRRKLRIGYLLPSSRGRAVSCFLHPLLKHHDRNTVEIICFATEDRSNNSCTEETASAWDFLPTNDNMAAQRIQARQIDILVDLGSHGQGGRMRLLALKPAPLQVGWLGYPGTSGIKEMDYSLTDAFMDPPGQSEQFYVEELVRVGPSFACYAPPDDLPEPQSLPADHGGRISFGYLNDPALVTSETAELWCDILHRVKGSRLVLRHDFDVLAMSEPLAEYGIEADRVCRISGSGSYFEMLNQVDVALDTFSWNGQATTCDTMWMGVPVITLAGDRRCGRIGTSLLSNLNLGELIARTPDEYARIAVELAGDRVRLARLRRSMRDRMRASPLMAPAEFASNVENIYRTLWGRWCVAAENTYNQDSAI